MLIRSAVLGLALLLHSAALAQVTLPDPAKAKHPGADVAPAAHPQTYPDEAGLQQRKAVLIEGLASNDLGTWRRGYFAGGDPGKYLPPSAMAMLLLDPNAAAARQYMNDERAPKEHYHFAAVNWARFYPLFGESALTEDTRRKFKAEAARYKYLGQGGTENHKTMWVMAANVLPHALDSGLGHQSKADSIRDAREEMTRYVRGLYIAGPGEWDSSTYMMFTVNGLLNVYDFSPDEEARLIAKAGLDWFATAYALKYRDGVFTAPHQRGTTTDPHKSIADQVGHIWFGSNAALTREQTRTHHYALHAATSSYRPNAAIYNLAKKKLPALPAEFRNTKANYWYGQNIRPKVNDYAETVFVSKTYTLASLWNGFGGQMTRWAMVADSDQGGVSIVGGHPRHSDHTGKIAGIGYNDGIGRYDRTAQIGAALITLTNAPDSESLDYAFVRLPAGVKPVEAGEWLILPIGRSFAAVRAVVGKPVIGQTDLDDKQQAENKKLTDGGKPVKHVGQPIVKIPGRRNGFILETADAADYADVSAFGAALHQRTKLEAPDFAERLAITYTTAAGQRVTMSHAGEVDVTIDGQPVQPKQWKQVFAGPYVHQENSVLSVNDGRDGFIVDFTGDLPVYRKWAK